MSGYPKRPFDIVKEIEKIKSCLCCMGLDCNPNIKLLFDMLFTGDEDQVLTTGPNSTLYWSNVLRNVANGLEINTTTLDAELGGVLLHDTTIDGVANYNLNFIELFNYTLQVTNNFFLEVPTLGTPAVGQVLTLVDAGTWEARWADSKYVQQFVSGDWTGLDLTILAATHGKGLDPMIQVYDSNGHQKSPEGPILDVIRVSGTGDIVLSALTAAFDGKIIIM